MTDRHPPLELLGLAKDPFADVGDAFFPGADRGRQLEELRHLSRWPRRVLAVTGERGVGKTTLYRALSNGLDPGVKAARINANLTSDTRSVLSAVIQGFGIAAPANSQPQLLAELIRLHVQEQIDAKRKCVVLVDDAHLLELRALEHLLQLSDAGADEGLWIVFFAEAHFIPSLDKASRRSSHLQSWHEVRLTPFTDDDARRYIAFRFGLVGVVANIPFTPTQMALIVGGASGLPGRINALASAILAGELVVPDERRVLPRLHRAVAILLVVVIALGWLILRDATRPRPSSDAPVEVGSGKVALAIPQSQQSEESADDAAANGAVPETVAERDVAPNGAEDADALSPQAVAVPRPVAVEPASGQEALAIPPAGARAAPQPGAGVAPKPDAHAGPEPVEAPVARPQVAVVPKPPAPPSRTGPHDADWIRAQPGGRFTLQLFAASGAAQRDKFLAGQSNPERFALFQTRRDGKRYYVLLYGDYATRAEADAAAAALPASMGKLKPWVRTFTSVQASLN